MLGSRLQVWETENPWSGSSDVDVGHLPIGASPDASSPPLAHGQPVARAVATRLPVDLRAQPNDGMRDLLPYDEAAVMRTRTTVHRARLIATPPRIRRPWIGRVRALHARLRSQTGRWQAAYVAVLSGLSAWTLSDGGISGVALVGWVMVGAHAWFVASWLALDARRRRDRHDRSGLPSVRGWRLAAGFADMDPQLLLVLDATIFLYDVASLKTVLVRGSRRRTRTTYATSLRTLLREKWGPSRGVSGRRADRLLRADLCDRLGVVVCVPVGTASAYRLVDDSMESALARVEAAAGTKLISWNLGRDPRWDDPSLSEGARA